MSDDILTLSHTTTLHSAKLKGFADNNFKFVENGGKFSERVENTVGKRRNCSLQAISPFPTGFSKELYCRHIKTRVFFGGEGLKCIENEK